MMNKLLLAMTATFFSRSPKLQMQLMLAQNTAAGAAFVFRPFCAVPFKGGPMERFFADVGRGELGALVRGQHRGGGHGVRLRDHQRDGRSVASGETDPAAGACGSSFSSS